jgi:hypothetical protein
MIDCELLKSVAPELCSMVRGFRLSQTLFAFARCRLCGAHYRDRRKVIKIFFTER